MMKKTKTVIALILILITGMAFAQEVEFDGYVNSGLGVVITDRKEVNDAGDDDQTAKPSITAYGVDSEATYLQFRLNGAYTNADGNAGAKFRLQAKVNDQHLNLAYGFGWVKFIDIITVNAGLVDDGTWATKGGILGDDLGEGLGVLVKVSPIDGLNLGVGAYSLSAGGGSSNNSYGHVSILSGNSPPSNVRDWNEAKYTLNGSYTLPDLVKINAMYRGENKSASGNADRESAKAIAELQILAIDNLTAVLEGEFDRLQNFGKGSSETTTGTAGRINIYETVGYKLGDIQVGLNAAQYYNKQEKTDLGLRFNPWVSYTIGQIVPRLDVVYFIGGQVTGSTDKDKGEGNIERKGYTATWNKDDSVIGVRPSVKINLDSKTTLEIGDLINYEKREGKAFNQSLIKGDPTDSKFTNTFYVDLTIKF
jgi:maltoporin